MHDTVKNLLDTENNVKVHLDSLKINHYPKVIAVSKLSKLKKILPLMTWSY